MKHRVPAGLVVLTVLSAALGACGQTAAPGGGGASPVTNTSTAPAAGSSVTGTPGLPEGQTQTSLSGDPFLSWAGPGQVNVVTFGSSSCPKLPQDVRFEEGNWLLVTTKATSDGPCTMDFGPTTTTIDVPAGIDDTKAVQVSIDGQESTLRPR